MDKETVRRVLTLAGDRKITFILDNSIVFSNKDSSSVTICDDSTETITHICPSMSMKVNDLVDAPFEIYCSQYEHIQGMKIGVDADTALSYINKNTANIIGFDDKADTAENAIKNSPAKSVTICSPSSKGNLENLEMKIVNGDDYKINS